MARRFQRARLRDCDLETFCSKQNIIESVDSHTPMRPRLRRQIWLRRKSERIWELFRNPGHSMIDCDANNLSACEIN